MGSVEERQGAAAIDPAMGVQGSGISCGSSAIGARERAAEVPARDDDRERARGSDSRVRVVRMDAHVHSSASRGSATAALGIAGIPECYTPPEKVYEQARARGMDLVTLTDHDTIEGALALVERGFPGVVIGEEVTVYFPEDRCKLHVLVWGLSPAQHEAIDRDGLRHDVYDFAHWLKQENLAHSLAHPLYDQNGRLDVWHVERCALLFKCFETLNGAHDASHRDAIEAFVRGLGPGVMLELANRHDLEPVWPRSWEKGRTGGSDDHAMLNVGRTWTEIDWGAGDLTPAAFLRRVMRGASRPGGIGGDAALLAHQFASVGAHFAARKLEGRGRARGRLVRASLMRFAGVRERGPGRGALAIDTLRRRILERRRRSHPLMRALREALPRTLESYPGLRERLDPDRWVDGAPIGEHVEMERFVGDLSRAIGDLLSDGALEALRARDRGRILQHASAYGVLQVAHAPYIYSMFQQNKERWLAERLRGGIGGDGSIRDRPIRVAIFTDTLGDINGVSRFIRDNASDALRVGRQMEVITSTNMEVPDAPNVHNFAPHFAMKMPGYGHLEVVLPPMLEILRHVDRTNPDVIHVSTPGPVGLIGMMASAMKRVPVVGVYHTDFPAYVDDLFDDHALTRMARQAMRLMYRRFATVLTRSSAYLQPLREIGIEEDRMEVLMAGCDIESFNPRFRDEGIWSRVGVGGGVKVIYCGRVSVEKNLPMLTDVWTRASRRLQEAGVEARLVVVGDGPYRARMEKELARTPAHFLGFRHGKELSTLYASSDIFVFPSLTDTLGQVVMEAMASGLPAIVSDAGGPKELVETGDTGIVLAGENVPAWVDALVELVADRGRAMEMGRRAREVTEGRSDRTMFDHFWAIHERAWQAFLDRKGVAGRGVRA